MALSSGTRACLVSPPMMLRRLCIRRCSARWMACSNTCRTRDHFAVNMICWALIRS